VARRIDVRSASQMHAAVMDAAADADIYIAAAAVGDYRPQQVAPCKLKKQAGADLTLTLAENPDILSGLSALPKHPFLVGFAAETHEVATYARDKLRRKKLDMIAANQVGDGLGFETADNALTLYWADGERELPRTSKTELARELVACVAERFAEARG
jgi:phosphopantothenoylcysteine decarboxylase/phosphopantothenate--cysteine ligase